MWAFTDAIKKDGNCEPQPRRDAVEWIALDVIGAEEGDPDLVPDGKQRARSRLLEYAVASPVPQWFCLVAGDAAYRRDMDLGVDRVPRGSRMITFRFGAPVGDKNVAVASKLICPRIAFG